MPASLLLSAVGQQTVVNTTTETSVFSGTVPGGTLGTNNLLILRMCGDIFNNTGANQTVTFRVKYGGTTIHTFTTINIGSITPDRYADIFTVFLGAENATNAQRSMMEHKQGGAGSGDGTVSGGNDHQTSVNRLLTIDSTSDQTLEVTVQLPTASANLDYRRQGCWVEKWDGTPATNPGDGTRLFEFYIPDPGVGYIQNSSAETSVYSLTIPGGTIGSGNLLILRFLGTMYNNTGSDKEWFSEAWFGGSQIFDTGPGVANTTSGKKRCCAIEYWIGGHGATNSQIVVMIGQSLRTSDGAGEGDLGTQGWQANQSMLVTSLDSTANQTFEVRVTLNSASLAHTFRLESVYGGLVKA